MDIQYAALKLFEMASPSAEGASRVAFSAGGGAFLESMKVSRNGRDNWEPGQCPVYDPTKERRLSGAPITYDERLPVDYLSVLFEGRYVASAVVDLSPGCSAGIPLPVAVKEIAE